MIRWPFSSLRGPVKALPERPGGDPSAIQSEIIFDGLDRIRISWVSEPGELYSLQSSTNLAEPWQDLQTDPPVLVATTNLLAYELVVASQMQFFRVGWVQSVAGMVLIPGGSFRGHVK